MVRNVTCMYMYSTCTLQRLSAILSSDLYSHSLGSSSSSYIYILYTVLAIMEVAKNLLRDDIPEEENIFHFIKK